MRYPFNEGVYPMGNRSVTVFFQVLRLLFYTAVAFIGLSSNHTLAQTGAPGAGAAPAPDGQAVPQAANRMLGVFGTFTTNNGIANAAFKVTQFGGLPIFESRVGGWTIDTFSHVASLSKAITGVCISKLVDERRLQYGSTLAQTIPSVINALSPQFRAASGAVTIEQLLRHLSGLTFDPTQAANFTSVPDGDNADETWANQALNRPVGTPNTAFVLNNANYAILGLVIKTVSGESYESYCKRVTLTPQGADGARIGAGVRRLGAFDGWEMPARQYSNWYARAFNPMAAVALSQSAHDFIVGGTFDVTSDRRRVTYALGTFVFWTRPAPGQPGQGRNLWHRGDWNSMATTPRSFSAFAAMYENGLNVVMTFDRSVPGAALDTLERDMETAAFAADPGAAAPANPDDQLRRIFRN
jgi:CubicO group peptidase (beta-lactamase class C family)